MINKLLKFIADYLKKDNICNMVYPIGSIYWSADATPPQELFGGEWEQIKDVFLLAAGDEFNCGDQGGSMTRKLSTSNIPPHTHSFSATASSAGSHYHQMADREIYAGTGNYYACVAYSYSNPTAYSNTSSSGAHTHSVSGTTGASGSGTAFDIMPPYAVAYCWLRVG